ncbi:phosphatidylinositol mannoside acyltransferase [Actinobaculum suis]|uniref:phosphatidylinositol mannoside acyltransferase n=1 Tax=Actinobaculum suis TaxID=1657 RepID=UPI0009F62DCF|nr:phosphatidylinositol mannoside acyltransferase [Actinobaculum suis]
MNIMRVFRIADALVNGLPEPMGRALFNLVGTVAGTLPTAGTKQLRKNLARIKKDVQPGQLRQLSRAGMRSYMRYYYEALHLRSWDAENIAARVEERNLEEAREAFDSGDSLAAALMHMGNWDLAGAWSNQNLAKVATLVEKLEPEELYRAFVDFREGIGMIIFPVIKGGGAIHKLAGVMREEKVLAPVLADRDLTASGIEVEFFGEKMLAAAGPAILAQETGSPILPVYIYYRKAENRGALPTRWRTVVEGGPLIYPQETSESGPVEKQRDIERMTQAWVDAFEPIIAAHPEDWHMLQKVFVADLDQDRYLANREKARAKLAARAAAHGTATRRSANSAETSSISTHGIVSSNDTASTLDTTNSKNPSAGRARVERNRAEKADQQRSELNPEPGAEKTDLPGPANSSESTAGKNQEQSPEDTAGNRPGNSGGRP